MSAVKQCTNCGADNDLLLTNCQFCKTGLPQIDINSISNEDLILNAGEWIGKVGTQFEQMTENFNAWTGKGLIIISANQIEGMAQKYLSLLQVRSISNPNIQIIYIDLKNEFDKKRDSFLYRIGGGDKKKGMLFIFFLVFALVMLLIPIVINIF